MVGQILDPIPIWAMYLLTVLVLLVAMEAGYRLTKANQREQQAKGDAGVGAMAGTRIARRSLPVRRSSGSSQRIRSSHATTPTFRIGTASRPMSGGSMRA